MRTTIRAMAGLGLVALLAGPAFAQGQGRGFGMMGMGGVSGLLGNASVQKELKLDDQQTEKAKDLAGKLQEEATEKRQGLQDLPQEERGQKMMAIGREMNEKALKAIGEFLKPEQVTRLKQISYQQQGAAALADAEVAKKLNITDSQKSDIQSIVDDSRSQMRELRQQFQDDREGAMKKMAEIRKETLDKAVAKLNDEQQKAWKELIGSPFEVKYEPRPQ
jgi:LTXXQ motif family protein